LYNYVSAFIFYFFIFPTYILIIMQYILGNVSASDHENLDQSYEEWFAECLNETELNFNADDMYASLDYSFLV
jgi:hypothetical protein